MEEKPSSRAKRLLGMIAAALFNFLDFSRRLLTGLSAGKTIGIALTVLILAPVVIEAIRRQVRIETFTLPHDYEERGFTSQVFGNELADALEQIRAETDTLAQKTTYSLSSTDEFPDFELPETKISLRALAQTLQEFFHRQPVRVTGEIVELPEPNSEGGSRATAENSVLVTIRVIDDGKRNVYPLYLETRDPKAIVSAAAEQIVRMVDPYLGAVRLYDQKKFNEAVALLSQCRGDRIKWAWIVRGNIESDPARAESFYKTSLFSVPPDCEDYWLRRRYRTVCAVGYANWGNTFKDRGDYADAIAKYQTAIDLDKNYAVPYLNWGTILSERGDYTGAIAKYRKAIERNPQFSMVYNNWGYALDQLGDHERAIDKYREAITYDLRNELAYKNWGVVLDNQGDHEGAISKFQNAISIDAGDASAYCDWGIALSHKGDYEGAIARYKTAIELDPKYARAYYGWGVALANRGDTSGALVKLQTAIQLDQKNPEFKQTLGKLQSLKPESLKVENGTPRVSRK